MAWVALVMVAPILSGIVPERAEALRALGLMRTPLRRALREFAETEVVLPNGPRMGERFECAVQPFSGLLFDQMQDRRWRRVVVLGCTQSGKTLTAYVMLIMHTLFECGEGLIAGLPDLRMANDKWMEDIQPVILRSRYAEHLPTRGPGSRNGRVDDRVDFGNGASLRFMSGGGGDAARSGYTARVVAITEADKLDVSSSTSRETSKLGQLEARTDAYDDDKLIVAECTVSYSKGYTWREYKAGSASRIACPCPHCGNYVTPEREHLMGWKTADTMGQARRDARWICPDCETVITEAERAVMNQNAVLVHKGQAVSVGGVIEGDVPDTDTLGFRWNAFNNLFWSAASVAAREWRALYDPDEENSQKALHQFVWAIPWDPPGMDLTMLDARKIAQRSGRVGRGIVPEECHVVTVGLDLGQRVCHWVAMAFAEDASPYVIDYGQLEVPQLEGGLEHGLLLMLGEFGDLCDRGWRTEEGNRRVRPDQAWIDAGWQPRPVYAFVAQQARRNEEDAERTVFHACKGFGIGQRTGVYRRPADADPNCEEYHATFQDEPGVWLVSVNADYWKSWLQNRVATPAGGAGALLLFRADAREHWVLAKHWTAEHQTEEFSVRHQAHVAVWRNPHKRANHYLDAGYEACAAGHASGVRLLALPPAAQTTPQRESTAPLRTPDGRPFLATERE